MDNRFAFVGILAVIGAMFAAAFLTSAGSYVGVRENPEGIGGSNRLCQARVVPPADFTVLREVYERVRQQSVFVDEAADPHTLLRSAVVGMFKAISADEDPGTKEIDLPEWVEELLTTQRGKQEPDFGIAQQIFERMKQDPKYAYAHLEEPSRQHTLLDKAIRALLRLGLRDPFSERFTAEQWSANPDNPIGVEGEDYEGIGASLNKRDNGEIAIYPFNDETPAARAGIQQGDVLLEINGKSTDGCGTNDVVKHSRGKAGTSFSMTVRHPNGTVEELSVVSGKVSQNPVSSCPGINFGSGRGPSDRDLVISCPVVDARAGVVRDAVIYIKIENFTPRAARDLEVIMPDLLATDPKGMVIDLRGNPGGDLYATRDILNLFFGRGELLTRVQRPGTAEERWFAHTRFSGEALVPYDMPIVILVGHDPHSLRGPGGNSASAAELFPMTFRDHNRAVIIGDGPTAGKGTVTGAHPIRDGEYGGIYIASGFWLSPAGTFIGGRDTNGDGEPDGGGVIPDIVVKFTDEDYARAGSNPNWDPVMFAAIDAIDVAYAVQSE